MFLLDPCAKLSPANTIALVFFLVFDGSIIESWINSIIGVFAYFGILERNGNTSAPFRIPSVEISSPFSIKSELQRIGASNKGSDWMFGPLSIRLCRPLGQLASLYNLDFSGLFPLWIGDVK
jgi:hypothetical protein